MDKLFAIINIASAIASILGFALVYKYDGKLSKFKNVARTGFAVFLFMAAYTVFVPSNWFENSAGAKIQHYSSSTDNDGLLIQKDVFSIRGLGNRLTIEFPVPYAKPPEIRILLSEPFESGENIPHIGEIYNTHFVVNGHWTVKGVRPSDNALMFSDSNKSYKWIAQGIPLVAKVVN